MNVPASDSEDADQDEGKDTDFLRTSSFIIIFRLRTRYK